MRTDDRELKMNRAFNNAYGNHAYGKNKSAERRDRKAAEKLNRGTKPSAKKAGKYSRFDDYEYDEAYDEYAM